MQTCLFLAIVPCDEFLKHLMPVGTIIGLQNMYSHCSGRLGVVSAVIDKNRLLRFGFFALKHHLKDAAIGLHNAHLIAQIQRIKVVVQSMPAAIECIAAGPLHHKGVGVAEQAQPESALSQLDEFVKVALRQFGHIALPPMGAVVKRQLLSSQFTQLAPELLGVNPAALEIAEDANLGKRVKVGSCIVKPHLIKSLDSLVLVNPEDNTAQVKYYVLNHIINEKYSAIVAVT